MTRLWNDAADFADEARAGFVRSHARWVREVDGGVMRSTVSSTPEVAVVIGGGSGHYPAFSGLVGPGLAHGAVMGNIFASPSARQAESVIRSSEQGRGVLLSYGNYAGDVLHFTAAQDRVRAAGLDCRTVVVTDDISSAPVAQIEKRRGVAGDLVVFKIAGAAAARNLDLDDVERVARHANARTRTLGVAFSGCTLPGADQPLFTVSEGKMAVGLGIHGEPGIAEVDIPSAAGLAELLVARLLDPAEIPVGVEVPSAHVVPILNGLGSVKSEELFVVYSRIADLLEAAGAIVVDPRVGEFCTSFDMAGASLTLFWVDDELEGLWLAAAETPAFRTGTVDPTALRPPRAPLHRADEAPIPTSTERSRAAAVRVLDALSAARVVVEARVDELGRLDAIAGDGDHGIGMQRGLRAAVDAGQAAFDAGAGAGTVLVKAGHAWSDGAGGTSGAIWGVILRRIGVEIGDTQEVTARVLSTAATKASAAVTRFGGAVVGDKTLVDALVPFEQTLAARVDAGESLRQAWRDAATVAALAAQGTSTLMPTLGRARVHGEKALGTADPGAVSLAYIVEAIARALDTGP